jgi:hypothetical protein
MDYNAGIKLIYDHLDNDDVDKAVMACLRIARNLNDYLYAAVFLHEMYPVRREFIRILYDDTSHLKEDAQKFLSEKSLEYWLDTHALGFSIGSDDDGKERNVLALAVGEIKPALEQWERSIEDLTVPAGMGEFDTAAFTDRYNNQKAWIRLQIKAINTVKERVKTRCFNYAIRIERQLQAQKKAESFLHQIHNEVNNYFRAHSEDVYTKLQKAAQLVGSNDPEDFSLLLTQVRRAIKASADYFYPPSSGTVMCIDGTERNLGDKKYLNRLHEYLTVTFNKSASQDLLKAELDHLMVFAQHLNEIASKGVHTNVSAQEAKQGLLGLYMFLYNVISHLQRESS